MCRLSIYKNTQPAFIIIKFVRTTQINEYNKEYNNAVAKTAEQYVQKYAE